MTQQLEDALKRSQDVLALEPQVVGRFYGDGNRLGQRPVGAPKPAYYRPERWIGSSTLASNPPEIPTGGVSMERGLGVSLKALCGNPVTGPRLLGSERFTKHRGEFRVLIKLLDAVCPIPFHVHADDDFLVGNAGVYPNERFGKDEAYHFLDAPKGGCSYTHVGLHAGVTAKDVITAMRRGTDHVLEMSPGAYQEYGQGFMVRAGLLHRPGTALTLEIQQPSDVYTMFQTDFGGEPLPESVLYPGFASIEEAAERVVNWPLNLQKNLLEVSRLKPEVVTQIAQKGGSVEWVFPPSASEKFSGQRWTVQTTMTLRAEEPCVLWVWKGRGMLDGRIAITGGGGPVTEADEFFVGVEAARRGVELRNTGNEPLVVFAMFAAKV